MVTFDGFDARRTSNPEVPMTNAFPSYLHASSTIIQALRSSLPVVALESTVITHGFPRPQNLEMALDMERVVRQNGAIPATIAMLDGKIQIGLTEAELKHLANEDHVRKISRRDIASAIVKKECGGTTVAATMFAAHKAGIKVFATGGIGGIHDVETFDISADIQSLADTPIVVVCAGAKAILNLPATLEYLETMSIPVIGYKADEFPAFFSRESGLSVSIRLDSTQEIVEFAKAHWDIGMKSGLLVCQPLSFEAEIPRKKVDEAIRQAQREAHDQDIHGQPLTPFLLNRIAELTAGASLKANLALLLNNAQLAAEIAIAINLKEKQKAI
jgi:pseudouridine-5'-phosphate glycosidase